MEDKTLRPKADLRLLVLILGAACLAIFMAGDAYLSPGPIKRPQVKIQVMKRYGCSIFLVHHDRGVSVALSGSWCGDLPEGWLGEAE